LYLVGFITKKFVTMHGHRNVKLLQVLNEVKQNMSDITLADTTKNNSICHLNNCNNVNWTTRILKWCTCRSISN